MTTPKSISCLLYAACLTVGIVFNLQAAQNDIDQKQAGVLYNDYCSVCHGDRGDGQSRARGGLATKPRDFTTPGLDQFLTRERISYVILNGIPNTAMVGWKTRLSQAQANAIADYIHINFMVKEKPSATPATAQEAAPMTSPMPHNLSGDVESGKAFYDYNCTTCHGKSGEGNGPRAYFIFPKPRNFTTDESRQRLSRPVLFNAIKNGVNGREMPAWGKVLDDQQIANVVEYVFQNMIQPAETH